MRNLTLSRVLLPLLLLVLASGHQGAVQASHLSEAEDPPQQHFLRSLEGSSADSGDADGGGGVEKCQAGCSTNNDCIDEDFVCYKRKPHENLPGCCEGKGFDISRGDNYCVAPGCAGHTPTDRTEDDHPHWVLYDDDTFLKDLDKLFGICQGNCGSDKDCRPGLICYANTIPACCQNQTITDITGVTSFCAADTCNRANEAGGDPLGDLCFSGVTTVQVLDENGVESLRTMADLEVGDRVLSTTGGESYQTVYAFAHLDKTRPTKFLQIFTDSGSSEAALEVTENHLIFLGGKSHPVPAKTIRVGDLLKGNNENTQYQSTLNVTSIQTVVRNGVYAPLTQDGTVVVGKDNVVASSYVAVQTPVQTTRNDLDTETNEGHVEMTDIGTLSWLHQADVTHMWLSPLRLVCTLENQQQSAQSLLRRMLPSSICTSRNADDGMLDYVAVGLHLTHYMDHQPLWAQLAVLVPVLVVLSFCAALENLILGGKMSLSLLAALGLLAWHKYRHREQEKKPKLHFD